MIPESLLNEIKKDCEDGFTLKKLNEKYAGKISKSSIYKIFNKTCDKPSILVTAPQIQNIEEEKHIPEDSSNNVIVKDVSFVDKFQIMPTELNLQSVNIANDIQQDILNMFDGNNKNDLQQKSESNESESSQSESKSAASGFIENVNQPIEKVATVDDDDLQERIQKYMQTLDKKPIDVYDKKDEIIYNLPPVRNPTELVADDWKERKKLIIYIRQYICNFADQLTSIIGSSYSSQQEFQKNLPHYSLGDLQVTLENIRLELNIGRNNKTVMSSAETVLRTFESLAGIMKIDISGSSDELLRNPDFMHDLKMMACEINVSEFITPQRSVFMRGLTVYYKKYYENKLKNKIDDKLKTMPTPSKELLDKANNLTVPIVSMTQKPVDILNQKWAADKY